ncbi:ribonuclease D [Salinimonas sp. HHU 13199]|uniref:Ribonuclease D n=1 Tax=Salinimonas profundi TaxID=2729140 RepID=A0ABR8LMG2_9ALTE|nr:ribonuclease D [Salinimonas profundi]MBD3587386.1 ribonuclease D [Salinimonas profundi]
MEYQLITTSEQLKNVCRKAQTHAAVALDTEFVRTRTLTPQLGLLQLYDGDQLVLIDPLQIEDMQPFITLMLNSNVVKVLHSCSEDLEAFLTAFDCIPSPVFDTQFAASVLNIGPTLGYARLVEMLSNVQLDKGESRTDWLARPLSEKQLHYAANDVLYLLPVYENLNKQITEKGLLNWVFDEMTTLAAKKAANLPAEFAYLPVKNNWRLNIEQLTVLQHLSAWRIGMARKKDLALNFVLKESLMFEIAQRLPDSRHELSSVCGMIAPTMRRYGDTLLDIVQRARDEYNDLPQDKHLPRAQRLVDFPAYKKTLAELKTAANDIAEQYQVPVEVVASKKQLNQVLKWYWFDLDEMQVQGLTPDLLTGWRAPLFKNAIETVIGPEKEV